MGSKSLVNIPGQNPAFFFRFASFFPFAFLALWLMGTTLLSFLSGWFRLMGQYPDQAEEPMLRLRCQSGTMGLGVRMTGILTLSVCQSGLRVGMMRMFGPLCRNFFVPWEHLAIVRENRLLGPIAKFQFGNPVTGTLRIPAHTADRLARVAGKRWPEAGPFPEEKRGAHARRLLTEWAIVTSLAALFFTVAPLAVAPSGSRPPILITLLFPALFFGAVFFVRFLIERR
jgi:hypothetical protein